jgi:hypothetical protein
MTNKEEWLASVRDTIAQAANVLPSGFLGDVHQLVNHGEPAEAIYVLALVIVNSEIHVPASLISEIRDHLEGFDLYDLLPSNLDSFAS